LQKPLEANGENADCPSPDCWANLREELWGGFLFGPSAGAFL